MKSQQLRYKLSPAWRVRQEGSVLRLHGGGDAKYEVTLESEQPSLFAGEPRQFARKELSAADDRVFEQLLAAGVVEPVGRRQRALKVATIGDELPFALTPKSMTVAAVIAQAEIVLVVRCTSTHGALIRRTSYYDIDRPHLYIDLAYHHTVSIGPLVYPGETACIGCLYGRLRERWGDEIPPRRPLAAESSDVVVALINDELRRFAGGDTSLVGRTVAWDLAGRSTTTNTLLKSSACPRCGTNRRSGRAMLE